MLTSGIQRPAIAGVPSHLQGLPGDLTLGHIACGCLLGYLDLRHGALEWRKGRDGLAAWFADPLTAFTGMLSKVVKYWPMPETFSDPALRSPELQNYPKFPTRTFAEL